MHSKLTIDNSINNNRSRLNKLADVNDYGSPFPYNSKDKDRVLESLSKQN